MGKNWEWPLKSSPLTLEPIWENIAVKWHLTFLNYDIYWFHDFALQTTLTNHSFSPRHIFFPAVHFINYQRYIGANYYTSVKKYIIFRYASKNKISFAGDCIQFRKLYNNKKWTKRDRITTTCDPGARPRLHSSVSKISTNTRYTLPFQAIWRVLNLVQATGLDLPTLMTAHNTTLNPPPHTLATLQQPDIMHQISTTRRWTTNLRRSLKNFFDVKSFFTCRGCVRSQFCPRFPLPILLCL